MRKNILAAVAVFITFSSMAQDSFDDILARIASENPEIKAAAAKNSSELEALSAENMLEGPEIEAHHKWGNYGGQKYGFGISQGFDWPGLYRSRGKAVDLVAAANGSLNKAIVMEKKLEAKNLLLDIVSAKRNLEILSRIDSSMRLLADKYADGYKRGEVSVLDKNKIDIEVLKVSGMLTNQQLAYEEILTSVEKLAPRAGIASMLSGLGSYPRELLLSEADYENQIIEREPMLVYYRVMSLVGDENIRIARMSGLPSFSVGYEWEREEGQTFNGVNIGVKFSSWSTKHRKNAANLSKLENETMLDAESARIIADMRNDRKAALNLARKIDEYGKIFDNGNQDQLLRQALDGGEINLITYLQEVNYFMEARLDYESVCYEYNKMLAKLNRTNLISNN